MVLEDSVQMTLENMQFWRYDIYGDRKDYSVILRKAPEKRLLTAILERAVRDYIGSNAEEMRAARQWIFDWNPDKASVERFSFSWICEQLDLNQRSLREQIKKLRRLVRKHGRLNPNGRLTEKRRAGGGKHR